MDHSGWSFLNVASSCGWPLSWVSFKRNEYKDISSALLALAHRHLGRVVAFFDEFKQERGNFADSLRGLFQDLAVPIGGVASGPVMPEHGIHMAVIAENGVAVAVLHVLFSCGGRPDDPVALADDAAGVVVKYDSVGFGGSLSRMLFPVRMGT